MLKKGFYLNLLVSFEPKKRNAAPFRKRTKCQFARALMSPPHLHWGSGGCTTVILD